MEWYEIAKAYVNDTIEYRLYENGVIIARFDTYEEAEDLMILMQNES